MTMELTAREKEIESLVLTGRSRRQIAADLGIAEPTVAAHMHHILMKRGVGDSLQLIFQRCTVEPIAERERGKAAGQS